MKSERRHELKENELAKDLGIAGEFIKTHLRGLITGFIVVVAALFLVVSMVDRWTSSRQNEWANYFFASFSRPAPGEDAGARRQSMRSVAEGANQEGLAAWAQIHIGDMVCVDVAESRTDQAPEELTKLRQEGEQAYQTVLDRYGDQSRAVAKAHLGLGRLAETFGDVEGARTQYEKAAAMESDGARLVAAEALRRSLALADGADAVALAQRPATQPATDPATQPAG